MRVSSFRSALLFLFVAAPALAIGTQVEICHVPPGDPDSARTMSVGASALAAHLAHGDYEGACDAPLPCPCAVDDTGGSTWNLLNVAGGLRLYCVTPPGIDGQRLTVCKDGQPACETFGPSPTSYDDAFCAGCRNFPVTTDTPPGGTVDSCADTSP